MSSARSKSLLGSGLIHANKTVTGLSTTSASVANPCRETTVPVMADPSVPVWPSKERDSMGGRAIRGKVKWSMPICTVHGRLTSHSNNTGLHTIYWR